MYFLRRRSRIRRQGHPLVLRLKGVQNVRSCYLKLNLSFRFLGNREATAGTFTAIGIGLAVILLMVILCVRRNKQRQAQTRETYTPQLQIRKISFVDDSYARSDPYDSAAAVEAHHRLAKQWVDIEKNASYEARDTRLAANSPGFVVGHRGDNLDEPLDPRVSQAMPKSLSCDEGPSTADRVSPKVIQSRAYFPFPHWRPVSQTPSSPSIYPPSLSAVDDTTVCQLPNPPSTACQRNIAVPDQSRDRGANANTKKPSLRRVPVKPELYTTPPRSGVDQRSPDVVEQQHCGDQRPVPPPIPPKSLLRSGMPMQTVYPKREVPRSSWSPPSERNLTDFRLW